MSTQGQVRVVVPAGARAMPVKASGDFIFVKEASREIKVIVNGDVINMIRGDKRRFDRADFEKRAFDMFEVTNETGNAIECIFVVGEGDYTSQIFTGELSLVESIKTLSGGSKTHGIDLEYHVGFDEWEPSVEYSMQLVADAIDSATDYGYSNFAVWDYDLERVYLWGDNGTFKVLDKDLNVLSNVDHAWSLPLDHDNQAAYYDGKIYFLANNSNLYRIDDIDNPVPVSAGSVRANEAGKIRTRSGDGGFIRNGYFYIHSDYASGGSDKFFEVYLIKGDYSLEWAFDVQIPEPLGSAGGNPQVYYHRERDLVYMFQSGGPYELSFVSHSELNLIGSTTYPYSAPNNAMSGNNGLVIWWSDSENRILTADTYSDKSSVYLRAVSDREVQLHAYLWDGADPTTKKYFWVSGVEHIYFKNGGLVLIGDILGQIIRGLNAAGISVLDDAQLQNYKDYVLSLEYTDGRNVYKKDAGSATWAYSEFNDRGELFIPSQIKLRVLPELLTNVY